MEVRKMYNDKFVLSVIHDGHPVKETGYRGNKYLYKGMKEVVVPFDSEYIIRLKNKNNRACTARVFIDDKLVSKLGDFIVYAGGTVDLERFVDRSMTDGKKFKFVPLDHKDVDDPTSSENGIIKVEFRKAKQKDSITLYPGVIWPTQPNTLPTTTTWTSCDWTYTYANKTNDDLTQVSYCNSNIDSGVVNCRADTPVSDGATVEGGSSTQSFVHSNLDVEDNAVILQLKIVGIDKKVDTHDSANIYCTQCGNKARNTDKYCSKCGRKL